MNKFELKGKVVTVEVVVPGKVTVVSIEVNANNRTEIIPVIAFNKLAVVAANYTKIGSIVEVLGALRLNNKINALEAVAFKITEMEQKNTKNAQMVTKNDKKSTEINQKDSKNQVSNLPIKKLDKSTGEALRVYENLSTAAVDMFVKKSDLKRAIKNGTVLAGYRWSY